jgi:hypothetical protein
MGQTKLTHLIDSREYVRGNCFQHQLLSHLLDQDLQYADLTISQLKAGFACPNSDVFLSSLRLRTIDRELSSIQRSLRERPVWIYDQDPWEAFIDSGSCRGAYARISRALNVAGFLVTSRWWSNFIESQGLPCSFVKMWPLRAYCDAEPPWESRELEVGFKGTLHPHRRAAVEKLGRLGVHVDVLRVGSFDEFMRDLSRMKFFFHDEPPGGWQIDGRPIHRNCVWVKEVEAMARGCLAIRIEDEESAAYCDGLPAARIVKSLDDVLHVIESARSDPAAASLDSRATVEAIRSLPFKSRWIDVSNLLERQRTCS